MKRVNRFNITKESVEDMRSAKRFNPCLEITFRDRAGIHTHKINAGYLDNIDVYREDVATYVLSHNHQLGYLGLEVFEGSEKTGQIFIESYQVNDLLGKSNLATFNTIKRMLVYIH